MHKKSIIETMNDGNTSLTFFYGKFFSCELCKIKAGRFKSFTFGTKAGCRHHFDEAVNITLTQDFYIGVTPVKIYQYNSIINNNYCDNNFKEDYTGISWFGAKAYCDILNVVFENQKPSGFKFDLPTEAQWEYACRAGTTTAYFWGNSCNGIEANCNGHEPCGTTAKGPFLDRTTDVGTYEPNDWGFYDMHGNVCEWCRDWYKADYGEDATGPTGLEEGSYRVLRGGCYFFRAESCRSAAREYLGFHFPNYTYYGFRLALVPVQ